MQLLIFHHTETVLSSGNITKERMVKKATVTFFHKHSNVDTSACVKHWQGSDLAVHELLIHCVVPVKIHIHPIEGHWKFLGGGGF